MIRGQLIAAFDFEKDRKAQHTSRSYRDDGQWYVVRSGPGYANSYRVTEFDEDGRKWLEQHEENLQPTAPAQQSLFDRSEQYR